MTQPATIHQFTGKTMSKSEIMFVGELPVVLPQAFDRLSPTAQAKVRRVEARISDEQRRGAKIQAARLALELEQDMGVTDRDRIDAYAPTEEWEEAVDLVIADVLRHAVPPPPKPQRPQTAPVLKVVEAIDFIPPHLIEAWERHQPNLRNPNPKIRQAAWDRMAELEVLMIEGPARKWAQRAVAESIALAVARGEEVDHGERTGKSRILSRGGIDAALTKGHFDGISNGPDTYWHATDVERIARLYQDCYERMKGQLTPERSTAGGGRREGPQHAIVHAGEVLDILRANQTPGQITALNLVCGFDMSINVACQIVSSHRLTMLKHVKEGLRQAAMNWQGRPKPQAERDPSRQTGRAEFSLKEAAIRAAARKVA